jgi:drug/metabolite transporter (DMT)-like permease
MAWVGYALLSAFCLATADALMKKFFSRHGAPPEPDVTALPYLAAWARLLYATPWLVALLLLIDIPPVDRTFWRLLVVMIPLELVALVLYVKALQASPLSLTLPLLSLTPVFLLGTSAVMLGEIPSLLGGAGIGCIVLGAFLLHGHAWREGLWHPFRLIWRERGSRYMMAAAVIYSVTSNLGKQAILHSGPIFFAAVYFLALALAFLPVVIVAIGWRGLSAVWRRDLMAIGGFDAVSTVAHVLAIVQANVAYMIAVKRTSMLFGMAYGAWWFGEPRIVQRLAGALVMLLGVVLTVAG